MTQKTLLQSAGDGTAVPAGYVGEEKTLTPTAIQTITNTNTFYNVFGSSTTTKLTLTKGIWLVSGIVNIVSTSLASGVILTIQVGISTSPDSFDDVSKGFSRYSTKDNIVASGVWLPTGSRYFNISSDTDIYLVTVIVGSSGIVAANASAGTPSRISAVRIA